jgi:hypothetical protein
MLKENWADVYKYKGYYKVSDQGRVKTVRRIVIKKNGRAHTVRSKILKPWYMGKYNHMYVGLYKKKGRLKTKAVHRLVLEAFIGPCPPKKGCRHLDGDPTNNRLDNLCWGTPKENCADRERHGTHVKGSDSYRAVLTEKEIPIIRYLLMTNTKWGTLSAIAREYNIATAGIKSIQIKETWHHIPEVTWEKAKSRIKHCPNCNKETDHNCRKCNDPDYQYRECSICHYYRFAIVKKYRPPLEFKQRKSHKGKRGESCPTAKLTAKKVQKIRRLYAAGNWTYAKLAEKYEVGMMTIRDAVKKITWTEVLDT